MVMQTNQELERVVDELIKWLNALGVYINKGHVSLAYKSVRNALPKKGAVVKCRCPYYDDEPCRFGIYFFSLVQGMEVEVWYRIYPVFEWIDSDNCRVVGYCMKYELDVDGYPQIEKKAGDCSHYED